MEETFFSKKYNIITDCIFLPAKKPPKVCQDYSICSSNYPDLDKEPYLIICDGCGSSNNTDVGSRILAHSAKSFYNLFPKSNYNEFGHSSINISYLSLKELKINKECLDSTLIFSKVVENNYIETFMYGDGFIFSTNKNSNLRYIQKISFEKNAPYYLSYKLNSERDDIYRESFNGIDPIKFEMIDGKEVIKYTKDLYYINQSFCQLENVESYIISSDGIDSFINIKTGERISCSEIINEIISFKSKKGEFIKRRVRKMMEDLEKKNIYNFDDISIAAFMISEEGKNI